MTELALINLFMWRFEHSLTSFRASEGLLYKIGKWRERADTKQMKRNSILNQGHLLLVYLAMLLFMWLALCMCGSVFCNMFLFFLFQGHCENEMRTCPCEAFPLLGRLLPKSQQQRFLPEKPSMH